jgi:hypothetical protein
VLRAVLLASLTSIACFAQESPGENQAFLVTGPTLYRGADFLSPNVLPFWYGEYSDGTGDLTVVVYYFDIVVEEARLWPANSCNGLVIRSLDDRFFYIERNDWSFVIAIQARFPGENSFSGGYPDPSLAVPVVSSTPCAYAEVFLKEHLRFRAVEPSRVDVQVRPPAFPAILPVD